MKKNTDRKLTHEEIKTRVLEGMRLAIKRLVEEEKKRDSYLVFYENGKTVRKRARDIEL